MAKGQSTGKKRLTEIIVVVFVVLMLGALAFELGTNAIDTLDQSQRLAAPTEQVSEPTPTEPLPTYSPGSGPISETGG